MQRRLHSLAAATALVGLLLSGCNEPEAEPRSAPEPTPLAAYDGTSAQVARRSFCGAIPEEAVAAAVGTVRGTKHYASGEQLPGVNDVSHEYGCIFNGAGVNARAWVFAPPVTVADARTLVRSARAVTGCRTLPGRKFGFPTTGDLCRNGAATTVTFRGLFGDAWLSCSVTATRSTRITDPALISRAGIWCVQVATAASR